MIKDNLAEIKATRIDTKKELHNTDELKRGMALEFYLKSDSTSKIYMIYPGRFFLPYILGVENIPRDKVAFLFGKYPGSYQENFESLVCHQIPHNTFCYITRKDIISYLSNYKNPAPHCYPFTKKEAKTIADLVAIDK